MLVDAAESDDKAKSKQVALKINSLAQKFSMMIQNISDYSDLNNKDTPLAMVDMNKVLDDVCLHLEHQLATKDAIIQKDLLPVVHAVPEQMEQLVYHLVKNAVKFSKTGEPAVIKITSRELPPYHANPQLPAGKYCEISIEDNGIGIDKKQLEKIFDIFTQLTPDQNIHESGIGLAHCRKIVRNHGGHISARSELNKGSIFTIVLPVHRNMMVIK